MGTMLAVKGGPADIDDLVKDKPELYPANFNAPTQTIVSGREQDLDELAALLKEKKIKSVRIPVSCGFHSPFMEPAKAAFDGKLAGVSFDAPAATVYSNTLAAPYPADAGRIRTILSDHLTQPVKFTEETLRMYEDGARVFVEAGPGNVLTNLVRQTLGERPFRAVAVNPKAGGDDVTKLLLALAQLAAEGVAVDTARLY